MPIDPTPGRSLVTRRAVVDIIRAAALDSYGVTGLSAKPPRRVLAALGLGHPGIRVLLGDPLEIELDLTVAFGLPVAEVARQVDSAVRYAVESSLGRSVGRLSIRVDGLEYQPTGAPPSVDTVEPPAAQPPARPQATRPRAARSSAARPSASRPPDEALRR